MTENHPLYFDTEADLLTFLTVDYLYDSLVDIYPRRSEFTFGTCDYQGPNGVWNRFGGKLAWGPEAIVRDDPNFQGQGNPKSGKYR